MKNIMVVIFVSLALVVSCEKPKEQKEQTFSKEKVSGADWKLYGGNDYYLGYYHAKSITHPSKNIVRVWAKMDFTEKGVLDWVRNMGKKYENLSYGIVSYEINCAEKKARQLSVAEYDHNGNVIAFSSSPREWDFIVRDSMVESLYKEVCK